MSHQDEQPSATSPTPDELARLAALKRRLARERGPLGYLRERRTPVRLVLLTAALGVGLLGMHRAHPDVALQALLAHAAVFIGAACVLFWPLSARLPEALRMLASAAALALPVLFAIWVAETAHSEAPYKPALPCFTYGAALAAPFVLLLRALDRHERLGLGRTLLAGAIAATAGNALLHLHCANTGFAHLLLGHATLTIATSSALWLVGRFHAMTQRV